MVHKTAAVALLLAAVHAAYADDPENTDWPLLGNAHEMQHHADLSQINTDTVGRLGLAWWVDLPTVKGMVGNPLISDGRIFQSGAGRRHLRQRPAHGRATVDLRPPTRPGGGDVRRSHGHELQPPAWRCTGELVIVGTGDCRLVAVDQETGAQRWEAQACDQGNSQTITAAPRVGGGMVFTGNACGDSGMSRGHVDAFDADTGRHAWRFYTVPGESFEAAGERPLPHGGRHLGRRLVRTHEGLRQRVGRDGLRPGLRSGCTSGSGVRRRSTPRPGERTRATSCSRTLSWPSMRRRRVRLALQAESRRRLELRAGGRADAREPAGVDGERARGRQRAEDGFVYVLDADTGEFLSGRNYVPVNWASGSTRKAGHLPARRALLGTAGRPGGGLAAGMGAHSWTRWRSIPRSTWSSSRPDHADAPPGAHDAEGLTAELAS